MLHALQQHDIELANASRSSGRNSHKAAKKKSHSRSYFRIRPDFALWIGKSMCLTTMQ